MRRIVALDMFQRAANCVGRRRVGLVIIWDSFVEGMSGTFAGCIGGFDMSSTVSDNTPSRYIESLYANW
jgi:hypothetical protein